MALTGTGGRGLFRIKVDSGGGAKLARIVRRTQDPTAMARAAAKALRRRMLPVLKSEVPVRTGNLKNSLRIVQRGKFVELRGAHYADFINPPTSLRAFNIINRKLRVIGQDISRELTR